VSGATGGARRAARRTRPRAGEPGPAANQATVSGHPEAWVYMLRCRDGSLYTGWTVDLERRLARHRAGSASRYTASRLPVALAFAQPMADRSAARREEARIKRLTRSSKLALAREQPAEVA
jgi:putative endonuclease